MQSNKLENCLESGERWDKGIYVAGNMENKDFDFEEQLVTRKHIDLFHMDKPTNRHNIFSSTKLSVSPTYVQKRHLASGSNASILKESPFLRRCINESKSLVLQYQCNTSLMFNFPMVGSNWYRYKDKLRVD